MFTELNRQLVKGLVNFHAAGIRISLLSLAHELILQKLTVGDDSWGLDNSDSLNNCQ
jgi:hypothetical protein